MLDLAAPLPAGAGEEILHLQGRVVGQIEFPQRQLKGAAMGRMGVEIIRAIYHLAKTGQAVTLPFEDRAG